LRLVVKLATGYRGYGLPMAEVISEGNVGLMQAAQRFEPERGFRFSTYAICGSGRQSVLYPALEVVGENGHHG